MKDRIVKNIPTMDLMSFLLETTDSPKHVRGLQIYQANKGEVATTIDRILSDYHSSPVSPPFNYRPVFPCKSSKIVGPFAAFDSSDLITGR